MDKPTAGGTGYLPANLQVDTAAGVLKITTTAGIASGASNTQDNALGVGIDAADQISILDTTLVNLPTLVANFQQAGLWYGIDNDNYLKLVVVYDPAGTRAQFAGRARGRARSSRWSAPRSRPERPGSISGCAAIPVAHTDDRATTAWMASTTPS